MSDSSGGKVLMVSSDGHVTARMEEWRPYLPAGAREDFDTFLAEYREKGTRNSELRAMSQQYDPEVCEVWKRNVIDRNRLEGTFDPVARLAEAGAAGIAAEVLFPDFGLPFELYSPGIAMKLGWRRTPEQVEIGRVAYNRWLADFCAAAPERFAGLAVIKFDEDVDASLAEIGWAKDAGLRGIVLPMMSPDLPVFHPSFDRIWATLSELEMPVNAHTAVSSTAGGLPPSLPLPHPSARSQILGVPMFFQVQQFLTHFIWGGILERFPQLQLVFTETGSSWVPPALEYMDYSWDGSYMKSDIRELVKRPPSEYFKRQCHLGSSIFSRAEIEARHSIGLDKMALGWDYPHMEGSWGMGPGSHISYLQASLGVARVPADEARMILGEHALKLWGFDRAALEPVVQSIGVEVDVILQVPEKDEYPRGDIHKPLAGIAR